MAIPDFFGQQQQSLRSGLAIGSALQNAQSLREQRERMAAQDERLALQDEFLAQQRPIQLRMQAAQAQQLEQDNMRKSLLQDALLLSSLPEKEGKQIMPELINKYEGNEPVLQGLKSLYSKTGKEYISSTLMAVSALSGKPLTTGKQAPKMGTYNPRDYTSESWATFVQTENPEDLERYKSPAAAAQEQSNILKQQELEQKNAQREIELAQKEKDTKRAQRLEIIEAENAVNNIDSLLLPESDLDVIFGREEQFIPDWARSQEGLDMKAKVDNVVATLKLMAAGKIKGQGTVTENERTMLAEAATTLQKQTLSPEEAEQELMRIKPIFSEVIGTGADSVEEAAKATVYKEGQRAKNSQTGEVLIFTNGRWVPET